MMTYGSMHFSLKSKRASKQKHFHAFLHIPARLKYVLYLLIHADFRFLEYGQARVRAATAGEPKLGTMIKSVIRCDVPENGVAMTCGVGSSNAKASSTSVSNEKAFSFGQSITVGVGHI